MADELLPGEVIVDSGTLTLNEGRDTTTISVANTGDRPVQVGSHFHFFEANAALAFDRADAYGMRLSIPAGTAIRFEPGQVQTVGLVEIGGERIAHGMNGLVNGSLDGGREAAMERARAAGFADATDDGGPEDDPE